jgi:hypothetical protein
VKLHASKSVLFTIAAVLLTFGVAACGGSDGNGNGNGNNNNNGGGLTQADFEDYCSEVKSCLPNQSFDMQYDSVEDCASSQNESFQGLDGACGTAAQNYYECFIQNFQCTQGTPQPDPTACQDEITEFSMQCGGL